MDSVSLLSSLPPAGKLNGRNPLKAIALASSAVSASACMILTFWTVRIYRTIDLRLLLAKPLSRESEEFVSLSLAKTF
ncbi:MAG: hypothetical protein ACTS5A_03660, partial [Candidatus Hodgkinia cicadicola]